MSKITVSKNPEVDIIFKNYPIFVNKQMNRLRKLILNTAEETDQISEVEETLKWNEPAYLTKSGSTIRIDWKEKTPDQYAMYFKCTSKLVPTFKEVFKDLFRYEGTRAIVFQLDDQIPEEELKRCIRAALTYHRVKNIPSLGL